MKGDLHCHTTLSDGSLKVEQVISLASMEGIDFLALTDHDAIHPSFYDYKIIGERYGVHIIEGVELSCYDYQRGRKVHILCYCPQKPDKLDEICAKTQQARKKAGLQMIRAVIHKYPVDPKRIAQFSSDSDCVYKQHIMCALFEAGYSLSIYGELYQTLFNRGGIGYVPISYPDVRDVLKAIHAAGGIAVIAHPMLYRSIDLLMELIDEDLLDGIEVWHPKNGDGMTDILLKIALENNLLPTGGSDFHGLYNSINTHIGKCYISQKYLEEFLNKVKGGTSSTF